MSHKSRKQNFKTLCMRLVITFSVLLPCLFAQAQSTETLEQKIAARRQLTDVPTLYLTVPDALNADGTAKPINDVLYKSNNVAEYHTATIQVVDETPAGTPHHLENFTETSLKIKVRGNSTAKETKRPYRLKFGSDEKDADGKVIASHKHDLAGYGYKKRNWALLALAIDPSKVRNALTYHLGKAVDMPFCPVYKFVDLVINDEYRGIYQVTDHVEVGSHRIDIDEETGWFLESSRGDMVESPSVGSSGAAFSIKNPEPADEAATTTLTNQIKAWWNQVDPLFALWGGTLDLATFTNPKTGWRKYFDEESLVNFYIGINLTGDYDGFMTVKMYRETNGKMQFGPIWDKDLAFGNWSNTQGKLVEEMQSGFYFNSYIMRLIEDPVFIKKVHDRLHSLLDAGLVADIQAHIDTLGQEVSQTQALDHTKWVTSYSSWNSSYSSYNDALQALSDYWTSHVTEFTARIDEIYTSLGGDAIVDNTQSGGDSGESGGESGESGGSDDTPTGPYETTLAQWQNVTIPASIFPAAATKATLTVTGASYIAFSKQDESNTPIDQIAYSWNDSNQAGVTFDIDGELLEAAKTGITSVRVGGGSDITLVVTFTVPENTTPGGGDTPGGEETPSTPTHQQLTTLPTLYLTAEEIGNEWTAASLELFDQDNKLTQGTTATLTALEIQYQGSHKENSKDSFRLKFGSKTKLLASGKYKQWVLISNDDDPSLMRNALAKEIGDGLGLSFTPGYQFVDLYLNDTYMGCYQLTDRIKVESGRALVSGGDKDADWQIRFCEEKEVTEDAVPATQYLSGNTAQPYVVLRSPDADEMTDEALASTMSALESYFLDTFFARDAKGHYANVRDNVDQQQLFAWYIAQEILCVYKGFSSIEAYRSISTSASDQKLHWGPLWDSEKSLGNSPKHELNMTDKDTPRSYKGLMINYADYGMMKRFFADLWKQKWFAEGVCDLWNEKHESLLSALQSKVTALAAQLAESQALDHAKWENSLDTFESYETAVTALSTFITNRFAYLDVKLQGVDLLGDVTNNKVLDQKDVPALARVILQDKEDDGNNADLNDNGKVTVEDLTILIGKLLPESSK